MKQSSQSEKLCHFSNIVNCEICPIISNNAWDLYHHNVRKCSKVLLPRPIIEADVDHKKTGTLDLHLDNAFGQSQNSQRPPHVTACLYSLSWQAHAAQDFWPVSTGYFHPDECVVAWGNLSVWEKQKDLGWGSIICAVIWGATTSAQFSARPHVCRLCDTFLFFLPIRFPFSFIYFLLKCE